MPDVIEALEKAEHRRLEGIRPAEFKNQSDLVKATLQLDAPRHYRSLTPCKDLSTTLLAPLFYDQPLSYFCAHHSLADDPSLLKWMGDRELFVPVLETCYHHFSDKQLEALVRIPHVSQMAFDALQVQSATFNDLGCICMQCAKESVVPYDHLSASDVEVVNSLIGRLREVPTKMRGIAASFVNDAIRRQQVPALKTPDSPVETLVHLTQARACEAVPQLVTPNRGRSAETVAAAGVGLEFSDAIEPKAFLEAMEPYRGCLSSLVDAKGLDLEKAKPKIDEVNAQLRRMNKSTRMTAYRAITGIFHGETRSRLEEVIGDAAEQTGLPMSDLLPPALQAVESVVGVLSQAGRSRPATLRNRALATYFGVQVPTIQVWRLRNRLGRA